MTVEKLACPACGEYVSKVVDSRPSELGIWRRRECLGCHARFSTQEVHQLDQVHRPAAKKSDVRNM